MSDIRTTEEEGCKLLTIFSVFWDKPAWRLLLALLLDLPLLRGDGAGEGGSDEPSLGPAVEEARVLVLGRWEANLSLRGKRKRPQRIKDRHSCCPQHLPRVQRGSLHPCWWAYVLERRAEGQIVSS